MTHKRKTNAVRIERSGIMAKPTRPYFNRACGREFAFMADADVAELRIYDEIGYFGVSAKSVRDALDRIQTPAIKVRVNSPGGDVFDGIAIYNDLLAHPARIDVDVSGLAASAASIIAMAGDTISMAQNAFMMVHNAWGLVIGNRQDMQQFADELALIDNALADTYVARTGADKETVQEMMDAETWLTAEAAVDQGFADTIGDTADVSARFDLSLFKHTPAGLSKSEPLLPATSRDLETNLREAGMSRAVARTTAKLAKDALPLRDADKDIGDALAGLLTKIKSE